MVADVVVDGVSQGSLLSFTFTNVNDSHTIGAVFGCVPTYFDTTVTACNTYTWNGMTYNSTGDKTFTTPNSVGCDSVITLHLTIISIANTFTKTDACYGAATGTIRIDVANSGFVGTPPYTYRLGVTGPISSTTNIFNNLKAGIYRAYVLDAAGCIGVAAPIVISQYDKITATATGTDLTCYGSANGTITISNPSGFAPFQYKTGSGGVLTPFTPPYTITGLAIGNYGIYVVDAYGCSSSSIVVPIAQPGKISGTLTGTDVTGCNGNSNGSLSISNPIGNAPFMYKVFAVDTYSSFAPPVVVNGLRAGNYSAFIQDANGCVGKTNVVTVSQPAPTPVSFSVIQPTCSNSKGAITLSSPGNPGATFKISPGSSIYKIQSTYISLIAGTYYGYAKDAGGCTGRSVPIVLTPASGCSLFASMANTSMEVGKQAFDVSLSPNPSSNQFTLVAHSSNTQPVSIRVVDAVGRKVYEANGNAEQAFRFGNSFANGLYMIEVRQGDEMKIMKAFKGR